MVWGVNLNKVMILGNLTRDPESKTTPSGQTVANFGIATNRFYMDGQNQKQQKVEFHNIVAWGKLGDICAQYLKKGQLVFIEGRIETRSWDGQDGVKRFKTEIIAEKCRWGRNRVAADTPPAIIANNSGTDGGRKH